jgi:hypothetical protein
MTQQVEITGEWAAFLMYLCVNAGKAWENGLAGAAVAEQLCRNLGIPYERASIVHSLSVLEFKPMALAVDYRDLNELNKFAMWCGDDMGYKNFHFLNDDKIPKHLNKDQTQHLTECLWKWREGLQDHVRYVPEGCH